MYLYKEQPQPRTLKLSNPDEMTEAANQTAIFHASALLVQYSFDLGGYSASEIIHKWLESVQASWVRLAVIEALYQGRYKSVSVEQILALWQRRGQPLCHFNHEFERIVCSKLPGDRTIVSLASEIEATDTEPTIPKVTSGEEESQTLISLKPAPLQKTSLPSLTLPFSTPPQVIYQADWTKCAVGNQPIQQFVPQSEFSPFYIKLQAVAHSSEPPPE